MTKTVSEFRKIVRAQWPHVKVSVRTVSFADLARASAKFLSIENAKPGEHVQINALAREANIIPDTTIRLRE